VNATLRAQRAYAAGAAPTRTEKGLEYEVIARITYKLRTAAAQKETAFAAFAEALNDNRRLWQLLASDVANDGNQLPAPLRARIFYLAEFTFTHTRKVMARKDDVQALIDINTAIMRGLNPRKP
jgi:flagellar protein FlaF